MKLLTKDIELQLRANAKRGIDDPAYDPKPVVKLFTPWGANTWLLIEMLDEDTLYGLCDLGFGFPELGTVSLTELCSVRGPGGLGVERDLWFVPDKTLSQYADEAQEAGRIVT